MPSEGTTGVEVDVLGPLRLRTAGGAVEIAGTKERIVLARLVAGAGRTVPVDELADLLWGDLPPRNAAKSVQNYVLRLRNLIEPDRAAGPRILVTDPTGYRLVLPDDAVDARRFARLTDLGRRAMDEGRTAQAAATLTEALAPWRGPAYAGFEDLAFAAAEQRRLGELRLLALEDRLAADIDLGRARECVPELEAIVPEHPLRERLWELLVLALSRSGRQADALAAYDSIRRALASEIGVDPGPALRGLHARVLSQDAMGGSGPLPLPVELTPGPGLFVGRDVEMERLRAAWARASSAPVTVVLRGPEGTGVRRLAAELAREVVDAGHDVVVDQGVVRGAGPVLRLVLDGGISPVQHGPGLTVLVRGPVPDGALVLDVGPLAAPDVLALLETYLEPDHARAVLSDVLRRSGGRPAAVHDLAVAAARELVTSRVQTAAAEATSGQRRVDDALEELRGGVEDLDRLTLHPRRAPDGVSPWPGLAYYDIQDAASFAGRERLSAELVARLQTAPVMAVVGGSGSGKSSVVRAGLLAALREGVLPGSEGWTVLVLRPGPHPMRELAQVALQGREPTVDQVPDLLRRMVLGEDAGSRLVLVVDQMEELYTSCQDVEERTAFLDAITGLVQGDRRSSLVLVIRSDYAGELAARPELARAMTMATVLVGAPTQGEVRRAVELPAERAGLVLDVGLVDALVADAGDRSGVLPLLSTALSELWERRAGQRLTMSAYVASGGVSGALARRAERAVDGFDEAGLAAVRLLLLRLAGVGENASVVRRRVPLAELEDLPDPLVRAVVEPLSEARLVTLDHAHVEVAHEALFTGWPRLRQWLEEDAAVRSVRTRLATAALDWDAGGREHSDLWRGAKLSAAVDLARAAPAGLTGVEAAFVAAGRDALEQERRDAEHRAVQAGRQNGRLRRLLGVLVVLLVVAVVSGVVAVRSGERARVAATEAQTRELSAAAVAALGTDPELAVLLASEAVRRAGSNGTSPPAESVEALHRAVTSSRAVLSLDGIGGSVDWSPAGDLIVTEGPEESGLVDLRDARTGESVRSFAADDVDLNDVVFSPDGGLVATAGDDGTLRVWDPLTGTLTRELPGTGEVWAPAFGPDAATVTGVWAQDDTMTARTWDLRSGTVVSEHPVENIKYAVALSPDGTRAVGAWDEGRPTVWDVGTGEDLLVLDGGGWFTGVSWSPDGRWIATSEADHVARIWDARTGRLVHSISGHAGEVVVAEWSPDSARLATGAADGTVKVWSWDGEAEVARPSFTLSGSGTRGVYDVAWSPDGTRLLAGDLAVSVVSIFDVTLDGDAEWANVPGPGPNDWPAADFAPDGQLVVSGPDGTLVRWDVDARRAVMRLLPIPAESPETVRAVAPSPDGGLVAGISMFGEAVTVWDAAGGDVAFEHRPGGEVSWTSWSPGGDRLVLSGRDGTATVLDREGVVLQEIRAPGGHTLDDATISPDGRRLTAVVAPDDRTNLTGIRLMVWDLASGDVVSQVEGVGDASRLDFCPGTSRVAVGSWTGPALVVDIDDGSVVHSLEGHTSHVTDVDCSPDGSLVATSSGDGSARLWDTRTGRSVLTLPGKGSVLSYVGFSPDGTRLMTAGQDDVIRVWALELDDLLRMAEEAVTRGLTDAECRQYLRLDRCETDA